MPANPGSRPDIKPPRILSAAAVALRVIAATGGGD